MENGVEKCPYSSRNDSSLEILDEAIVTLKRCLTLTNATNSKNSDEDSDEKKNGKLEFEEVSYNLK